MSAPRHIPTDPLAHTRSYSSPVVVPHGWRADRPGDLPAVQPAGGPLGHQGPDQGYALTLTELYADLIVMTDADRRNGVSPADVHAGCVLVALRRASMFGRAPVVHDLDIAYRVWGWLDLPGGPDGTAADLVAVRGRFFVGVAEPHNYTQQRRLVAAVDERVLTLTPAEVRDRHEDDWRAVLAGEAQDGAARDAGRGEPSS